MADARSIRYELGFVNRSKTVCGSVGNNKRFLFWGAGWFLAVTLLFVSPSFAQAPAKRIADEREIVDAIDESGVPVPGIDIRETLEAVAQGGLEKTMALLRELDRSYKEKGNPAGAPFRERMELNVVADDAVLARLSAFVQRETAKRPVDWSLVRPALVCLRAESGDDRVVAACQAVFSVPLEDPVNKFQTRCVELAMAKLARQCTPRALDTLRQCTKLGSAAQLDILPASPILNDVNGCPTPFAIRLATIAASSVVNHAPADKMVAFFSDVERDTTDVECHPLIGAIDVYVRDAESLLSGKDPFSLH